MDRVAGGGADRRMTVVEESWNVLGLVVAGHHELDAVSHEKPSRIWNQRDSVLDRLSDRHCLRVAAREDWPPARLSVGSNSRRLARSHPLVMAVEVPSGATSLSRTIHAVSMAVMVTDSCNSIGPTTSKSASSGALCQ